jgi:hypothetical protein
VVQRKAQNNINSLSSDSKRASAPEEEIEANREDIQLDDLGLHSLVLEGKKRLNHLREEDEPARSITTKEADIPGKPVPTPTPQKLSVTLSGARPVQEP